MTTLARFAVAAASVWSVVVIEQRVHIPVDDEDNITAVPAITAVGSAEGPELFAEDRCTTMPTVTTTTVNGGPIYKRCHVPEPGADLRGRDDIDDPPAAMRAEFNNARSEREQRVIATASDVAAGMEVCAALANDDLPGVHSLAAKTLHAQALRIGIAPVARTRSTLFMRHGYFPALMSVIVTVVVS